jgi:hypothetical protein
MRRCGIGERIGLKRQGRKPRHNLRQTSSVLDDVNLDVR